LDFSGPKGALLSKCKQYRFVLWRSWDTTLPKVLFIGLNPSKANQTENDATTKRIHGLSKGLGFGGFFLMNCFPYIATDPNNLNNFEKLDENDALLLKVVPKCSCVIFAWGNNPLVTRFQRDAWFIKKFPNAQVLDFNKNGSPKHPLYVPYRTKLKAFKPIG